VSCKACPMNQIQYTSEQAGVIHSNARNLVVNAFAGTGKTTTLRGYASARSDQRILYLAFNKVTAAEAAATFPANVECRTMHSIAYAGIGYRYKQKLGPLRPNDITRFYGDVSILMANYLVKTLENFMYSADAHVSIDHVPSELSMSDRQRFVGAAQKLWQDMADRDKVTPLPHDGYLKLYQLSKPVLSNRYDIILLDEGQDTNPVTAAIVLSQPCGKVLVGDRHQSIYAFRGSINAMEILPGSEVRYLTQSMRFGEVVATAATCLLRHFKAETQSIIGLAQMATPPDKVDRSKPYAIISRTNAKVFGQAVRLLNEKKVHFVGGMHNYLLGKLNDIYYMWSAEKDRVNDMFYREFDDFQALASYARETDDKEVLSLVSVVNEYRSGLPALIEQVITQACDNPEEADVLLLTAHRSKGLQFDQVILDDDFPDLLDKKGQPDVTDQETYEQEVNLLYVAMTRAKKAIEFNRVVGDFMKAVRAGNLKPLDRIPADTSPISFLDLPDPEETTPAPKPVQAPHRDDPLIDEALAISIGSTILRHGPMPAVRIASIVGQPIDVVADKIVAMIRKQQLSSVFFAEDENIQMKLVVRRS
jgi:F-box protein 18 (helicase)